MKKKPEQIFLTASEAEICLELWATKKFDTAHIASFLRVKEHAVSRCIHPARGLRNERARGVA